MTRNTLTMFVWFGVALQLVGGVAWVLAFADGQSINGALAAFVATVVLSVAGSALLFVGLVGWAVLLGMRSHAEEVEERAATVVRVDAHSARLRG